jgi:hypothetical protein
MGINEEKVESVRLNKVNDWDHENLGPEIIEDDVNENKATRRNETVNRINEEIPPSVEKFLAATENLSGRDLVEAMKGFAAKHEQYLLGRITEQENMLAKEARQLYCSMTTNSKLNLVTMAQSNGLLAASILMPGRSCAKLTGMGEVILLQQCKVETVSLTYKKTKCGNEPLVLDSDNPPLTISRDGLATYPFSECFWPTGIVNINGKPHELKNNTWVLRKPTLHIKHLKLVETFPEIEDKTFDYILNPRQMFENKGVEGNNVLAELISRIYQTETKSLDPVVMSESSTSNFWDISGWMSKLKVIIFSVIGIIGTATTIAIVLKILPLKKLRSLRKKKEEVPINQIESVELLPRAREPNQLTQQSRNNEEAAMQVERANKGLRHDHNKTVYVRGIGLVWEGCLCLSVPFPENLNQRQLEQ